MTDTQLARFLAKIEVLPSGCWSWTAYRLRDGYGMVCIGGGVQLAHRAAYYHWIGEIPAGTEIDHLCRTRHCVNPTHLEAVAHVVNIRRGDLRKSEAFRRHLSAVKTGISRGPMSAETKAKIAAAHMGRQRGPMSEDQRAKIAAAQRTSERAKLGRAKVHAGNVGRKRSADTCAKIAAKRLAYWQKRRAGAA